jgi:predicted PurR-regulated permease PerM
MTRDIINNMEKANASKIEISVKTILVGIGIILALKFALDMKDILLSLFIAYIVMSVCKQPVEALVRRKVGRGLAVFIVFLSFFVAMGYIFSWIIPPLVIETVSFIGHFPRIVESIKPALPINMDTLSLTQYLPNVTNNFIDVVSSVFSNAAFFVSTVFFSIYLTLDPNILTAIFSRYVSKEQLERIVKIDSKIEKRLGKWLLGQLFLMLVIGVFTYIGLLLLGVKYALPLGIIAGLLEAIPNVGPVIAAIPAFFVGFSQAPLLGLFTVFLSIGIQQFENQLIVPMVMKRVVGLHPILTLIVLVVGGRYAGVLGMFFAIPLALVVETIITGLQE